MLHVGARLRPLPAVRFAPRWSMKGDRTAALETLTPRERQVLLALMRGETAREICRNDYVAMPTVRSQIRSILFKLGVSSQLAAVVMAYRSGWHLSELPEAPATAEPERLAVSM
jgi:DNA-binding CsgD family transcriptional regulator